MGKKLKKVKKFLSKTAKVLLPAAAGIAIGTFAGPAAGSVGSFIASKLGKINISVDADRLTEFSADLLEDLGSTTTESALEKLIKSSGDIGGKKIEQMLADGMAIVEHKVNLAVESSLRPLMDGLQEALSYMRDNPRESLDELKEIIGEEHRQLLSEFEQKMDTEFFAISKQISTSEDNIKLKLSALSESIQKMFKVLEESRYAGETPLDSDTVTALCNEQIASELMASRYDIPYTPDLYAKRIEVESVLSSFIGNVASVGGVDSNVFVLLAGMGMGKTWVVAHTADTIQNAGYPALFFELRMGGQSRIASILGADSPTKGIERLIQLHATVQKPIFIILDGFDEMISKGAQFSLLQWILEARGKVGKQNIGFILASREYDWVTNDLIDPIIQGHKEVFYRGPSGSSRVSYLMKQFDDMELQDALERYNMADEINRSDTLKRLARYPFILRLLTEFKGNLDTPLPDPDNIDEFLPLFYDPSDPNQTHSILGRMGIKSSRMSVLGDLLTCCSDDGLVINKKEMIQRGISQDTFRLFLSSGLLVETFGLRAQVRINPLYEDYIRRIAQAANITFLKQATPKTPTTQPKEKELPETSSVSSSASPTLKKYNMYISLGDNECKQTHYEEALSEYKKAVNVAENELYEPDKILKAKELIKKTETLKNGEETYQSLQNKAENFMKEQQWSEAEKVWQQIQPLCSEFEWNDRKNGAVKQAALCKNKAEIQAKKEEERRKQKVREQFTSKLDEANRREEDNNYIGAKPMWEELLAVCNQEGWNQHIENIQAHIQSCNTMIGKKKNQNEEWVKNGEQSFNNSNYEKSIEYFEQSRQLCEKYGWQDGARYAADMINKCNEKLKEPVSYHGTMLARPEQAAMTELESLVGEEIPKVSGVKWDTFGFTASDRHVTQLGIYRKGLSSLPESIGSLKSLTYLNLWNNNLSSLPDSIGSLKSLKELKLYNNNLSSLPDSIGSLKSLETLWLQGNKLSSLPESIGSLKSLKELNLRKNKLSSLPGTIKKWLKELEKNGCTIYK
ncbi:MAG: hypothetical protein GF364_00530 [Candidatus Lokiarchaeota archaeon]|nr:hypothetical protein [Candidatus Lokiarchaeota archaeon]